MSRNTFPEPDPDSAKGNKKLLYAVHCHIKTVFVVFTDRTAFTADICY